MDLSNLNEQQLAAVLESLDCNTVLVAGAGSGKTTVVQNRIGYLLDDLGVNPGSIMVMTFTNKASGELKSRLGSVCPDIEKMWVGTFHSICVKILKQCGDVMGIKRFTIMDKYDSKAVLKQAMDTYGIATEKTMVAKYQSRINRCKNNLLNPKKVAATAKSGDDMLFAKVYQEYQNITWNRRTFDFDDLIVYTILLLIRYPIIKEWFWDEIKYVVVDEFQDTNAAQLEFVKLIAGQNNLFVVGDDDQSIYSFRNAKPEYLMKFQSIYANSKVLKLEQNFRSTKSIINASNEVIANNTIRHEKKMFCKNVEGDPILYHTSINASLEADWISSEINLLKQQGSKLKNMVVLYRTNSQSRAIEESFLKNNIDYKIVGAITFFERKEIKDLIAFIKLKANPKDEIAFKRVASLQDGWGKTTVTNMIEYANTNKYDFMQTIATIPPKKRTEHGLLLLKKVFSNPYTTPSDFLSMVMQETNYVAELLSENTPEAEGRFDNIKEFMSICQEIEQSQPGISVDDFIDQLSLDTSRNKSDTDESVTMMTIHSAKGLEYETVFLVGVEENLLPHANSLRNNIEEERRLMYVGMTRAKRQLYITNAESRRDFSGNLINNLPSRFIDEISNKFICKV